eukprot:TRINITY_DN62510_c0_g1_i2.p1 TRINITY_DN62510_c0_g1~~TRINITY_DN62510_c0_g1_i2.p1  ORF type:complete len:1491 (+),score=257.69 TRINITY_DN62510_c0_g1_i2:181-4473(+)
MADFSPVDGGSDRACRGAVAGDNNPAHYVVVPGMHDIEQCKAACSTLPVCVGIEFSPGRCETWTREAGIEASVALSGFTCLKLVTGASDFTPVDGAVGRVCRGADAADNSVSYYTVVNNLLSLGLCKEECRKSASCVGIEYHNKGRCEVWTRAAGIGASAAVSGYECYRYTGEVQTVTSTRSPTLNLPSESEAAQFLIQATFGPTLKSIDEIGRMTHEQWIARQMSLPASLHREYYRKRVAPRPKGQEEMRAGTRIPRCKPGSRWVNHALLKSDENSPIKVMANILYVNGTARTDLDPAYLGNGMQKPLPCTDTPPDDWVRDGRSCASFASGISWRCESSGWREMQFCQQTCFNEGYGYDGDDCSSGWASLEYEGYICDVRAESVGSWMQLSSQKDCSTSRKAMVMPAIWKANAGQANDDLQLEPLRSGIVILKQFPALCDLGDIISSSIEGSRKFYMLENRLELKDQTEASIATNKCSNVPRTFLNEKTCVLKQGCSSWAQVQLQLELGVQSFNSFLAVGGRYVFAVTKLRPTSSACSGRSRWQMVTSTTTTPRPNHATVCEASAVGDGWMLVRRTDNNMFPQTDKLVGTDVRGIPHTDPLGESFSIRFDESDFDEFLFASGDCQKWMVMRKDEVLQWYSNQERLILKSHLSATPYNATMYRRQNNREDPWLTFENHDHCKALYAANNFDPNCDSGDLGTVHKGLNVFIRKTETTVTTTRAPPISETSLSAAAAAAIRQSLSAAEGQGWLRDIDVSCSGVPAGAVVKLGSDYFVHVHIDEYNVYDFTEWTKRHPGGAAKIKQWKDSGFLLEFPAWHDMSRWEEGDAAKYVKPFLVGKLGQVVSFQSLPQPLQTEDLAGALGASNVRRISVTHFCDGGSWHPGSYALSLGNKEWDAESCRKQLLEDPSCSTEWFGIAKGNGHCWCVPSGSDCSKRWKYDNAYGTYQVRQEYAEACGSQGEVANEPQLGHQYVFRHGSETDYVDYHVDSDYGLGDWETERYSKSAVWTMQALYAEDQLRQRIAWALSQIFVCSTQGAGHDERSELWLNYYDIFVRNALGNFRDVLREVTYSPIMADYLTYKRSRAFDVSNTFPDENYAREVMQLFTIGIWQLNEDGTRKLDASGQGMPTYTQDNIRDFARVMTGFDEQVGRSNLEDIDGSNKIDMMRMRVEWHDRYPKPDLDGNFLGDGLPLCSDLPPRSFLQKGARYLFRGMAHATSGGLTLSSSSALYTALCAPTESGDCRFRLIVDLASTLACEGAECRVDMLQVVNVRGAVYEYAPPTCVHTFFFNGRVVRRGGQPFTWSDKCMDPRSRVAGVSCCAGCKNRTYNWMQSRGYTCENANETWPDMFVHRCNKDEWWRSAKWCQLACWEAGVGYDGDDCSKGAWHGARICNYEKETVSLATAEHQCEEVGLELCNEGLEAKPLCGQLGQ